MPFFVSWRSEDGKKEICSILEPKNIVREERELTQEEIIALCEKYSRAVQSLRKTDQERETSEETEDD